MNMLNLISQFVDILTLLYHEGRNVRHLAKNSELKVNPKYLVLRDQLATNRVMAWKQIQHLRQKAASADSGEKVQQIFQRQYKLSLDDLVELYGHQGWRGTSYGGNTWLPIAQSTKEVLDLLNSGKIEDSYTLVNKILNSHHNTGIVREKIKELDSQIN